MFNLANSITKIALLFSLLTLLGCGADFLGTNNSNDNQSQKFKTGRQDVEKETPDNGDSSRTDRNRDDNSDDPNDDSSIDEGSDYSADGDFKDADKEIEYGGNGTIYRIGDGKVGDKCKGEVELSSLKGTTYNFEFTALEKNTTIEIIIGKLCGVEGEDSNKATVKIGSKTLKSELIKTDGEERLTDVILENAGNYTFQIISEVVKTGKNQGQRDDFLVGKVTIRADKKLRKGNVTAN